MFRRVALLLAMGAVPLVAAIAQQPPTPRPVPGDTLRRPATPDTVRRTRDSVTIAVPATPSSEARKIDSTPGLPDSLTHRAQIRDSIKTPYTPAELPIETSVGPAYRWDRAALFATGAVTLADLLDRVPGVTPFRSGWLASAQTAAVLGDLRRVRVFRDGVELDAVDPRDGGVQDLLDYQLWQLDEVAIERSADEVRIHMRSWSVRNTDAYTRADIATGDEDTNVFRGWYGRRLTNGGGIQVGAQRYSTGTRNRLGGGGDAAGLFSRVGWARGDWTVDATYNRVSRTRNETVNRLDTLPLPRVNGYRGEGTLRAAYGDPDRGTWAQLSATSLAFKLQPPDTTSTFVAFPPATPTDTGTVVNRDTTASRTQYVATGGFSRWGTRFSATERYRTYNGRGYHAPALRASYDTRVVSAAAYAERAAADSTTRVDVNARLSPLPWLALQGAVSHTATSLDSSTENRTTYRAEAGLRLGGVWLTGGRIERGAGLLVPPTVYALAFALPFREPAVGGTLAGARGRLYKDVSVDVTGLAWDAAGLYRPQYQARAQILLATSWLSKFPSGNLGLLFSITDDYRSATRFAADSSAGARIAGAANALGAQLEIRIQRATLSYQIRNALNRQYEYVPGYVMPGPISYYGVRWEFWN